MNITPIFIKSKRTSNALLRDIRRRSSLNRKYEKRTLELLKKSIEERSRTYSALSKRDKEGGGIFGNLFGGSLLLNRLRGRGKGGSGGMGFSGRGPRKPLLPKGGGGIGRNLGRLGKFGKFGRVGPLAILGTGLDFSGRLGSGQNIAQATIGAGGGLAGALAGGAKGAAIGTAFGGPLGTLIGGIIGSGVGAFAGGSIADLLTGVNADRQRESQIFIDKKRREKTLFSGALDQFDDTLKTFEEDTAPTLIAFKKQVDEDDQTVKIPSSIIKPSTPFFQRPAVRAIGLTLLAAGLITAAVVSRGKSVPASQKIIEKILLKSPNLRGLGQTEQLVAIGKLLERTLSKSAQQKIRMRTSPFINKRGTVVPDQKGAPGKIKNKTNIVKRNIKKKEQKELEIKQEELVDKLFSKTPEGQLQNILQKTGLRDPVKMFRKMKSGFEQNAEDVLNLFGRGKISKVQKDNALNLLKANKRIRERQLKQYIRELRKFNRENPNIDLTKQADRQKFNEFYKRLDIFKPDNLPKFDADKLRMKNVDVEIQRTLENILNNRPLRDFIEDPGQKIKGVDLFGSNDLEPPDSTNIAMSDLMLKDNNIDQQIQTITNESDNLAMAPIINEESNLTNNLIVMNNPTTIRPMSLGGSGQRTVVIKDESFDAVAKYAQMTGLLTV